MNNEEIARVFLNNFLDTDQLNRFCINYYKVNSTDLVSWLNEESPCVYISNAFIWRSTPEDHHYWEDLSTMWGMLLEEAGVC